jgi:hypothetical protein
MIRGLRGFLCAAIGAALIPHGADASGFCGERSDFGRGRKLEVIGLTADGRLVRFGECRPSRLREIAPISGLGGPDSALLGIDFRVKDGVLYGVGNGGGIYQIDTTSGVATLDSQLTVPLEGASFGVDFNPAADRLRVVSDSGQNLRHNLDDDTTIADGVLKNGDATALGVAGAAYTNNDADASTATTLLDVDTAQDQISLQSPPNAGNLAATGKLTVDAGAAVGFDIYTQLDDGVASDNWGFASLAVNGKSVFYRINLLTGRAIPIGALGAPLVDIALPLDQ